MADNPSSPQLSPQVLALHQRMMEDATFIKRQQWSLTNYAALIYAAIIWFAQNPKNTSASWILLAATYATAIFAVVLLIWFQKDLCDLMKRIAKVNSHSFGGMERIAFDIKEVDSRPFLRGFHIVFALITVCIVGAI